ncbi:MAG TPA: LamG domain-containing protein [Candidatus Acidoferrum sp.]|nr:LamG domain-containing protein [Candidatus Acidoferrum sp.]
MKTLTRGILFRSSLLCFLTAAAHLWFAPAAQAGLTVDVHLYHDQYGYYFYPWLNTNTTPPAFPVGDYEIASWQIPTNGSHLFYHTTATSFDYTNGGGNYYHDFDAFLYGITNQPWSIWVTNATATNHFKFNISVTGLTSNVFGAYAAITYPANNQQYVSDLPQFTWTGPTNWAVGAQVWDYWVDTNGYWNYVDSTTIAPGVTNWTPSVLLPNGTNNFTVYYDSNLTATVVAATPTNTVGGQAISGWISTAQMETSQGIQFTVGQPASPLDFYLVARYDFEATNSPGADSSGNGNNPDCSTVIGPTNDVPSTDAASGTYARQYFGNTSFCFTQYDPAYLNLSNALSGNFSVTAWVKTTNSVSTENANAYFGLPIFFAAADYNNHCTIPLSITGDKAAFTVVAFDGPGTITLHSTTSVNDGQYHFLAATREQSTGLMKLYVDGNLEATDTGITDPVITQGYISVAGGYYQYSGLVDDVRIYSTNLSAADVAALAASSNIPTLASAIGATNLIVTTSGDANWFIETTNTYNGSPSAAQSGVISGYQVSTLSATVTGPGTLTFYWSTVDNDPSQSLDYEFSIDDPYTNDIADLYGGGNDWQSIEVSTGGPISIPPGQHTLQWTVYANGDVDPDQAGFLDQVVFTPPDTSPVSADISVDIYREQDPTFGDIFIAFPSFNSVIPAATGSTTNSIQSPNAMFSGQADQGGGGNGGSYSYILSSLDQLINEFTNGLWTLSINKGMPNERQFHFSVSVNGLTTNFLAPIRFLVPTNNAVNVPANTPFQWSGPTNFSSTFISVSSFPAFTGGGSTNLAGTATNWPAPPLLTAGTNQLYLESISNNFPGITFSVPVDDAQHQVYSWGTQVNLHSTASFQFVVTAGSLPIQLTNPHLSGGSSFQFSFPSQSGFTHTVLYRTNLVSGTWQTYTNVPGDGNPKTLSVPLSLFSPSKQGFIRLLTQ